MRLTGPQAAALFAIGAIGGLIGDAAHVQTGTTVYLADGFPFIWESALWFPLAVGLATVATGDLRLRLAPVGSWTGAEPLGEAAAAIAAVLAIYATTAVVHDEPEGPATTLVVMLAVLTAARFAGGRPALVCGLAAAVFGPLAEIVLVKTDVSAYAASSDGLFGVALWLPALYFAFGVVVSRLTELLTNAEGKASRRQRSPATDEDAP